MALISDCSVQFVYGDALIARLSRNVGGDALIAPTERRKTNMQHKEVDKNFIQVKNNKKYTYKDYREFQIEGFPWFSENDNLYRLPKRILPSLSDSLQELAKNSTGGAIRFCTNSPSIAIKATYELLRYSSGMPLAADAGFDIYAKKDGVYEMVQNVRPEPGENEVDMTVNLDGGMSDCIIYLPLYSCVDTLLIGFEENAEITVPSERTLKKNVLFYGSSITNGGCASRPGMAYPAIIGRRLDMPTINLGFSGNARGETVIAEEIGKLDLSAIVMEYDYNSVVEELRERHEPFFKAIRKNNPNVPVLIMSRVFFKSAALEGENKERRDIAYATYENAVKNGDKNVYFLCGHDIIPTENRTDYTSDCTHPNDLGFKYMAKVIAEFLQKKIFG